MRIVFCITLFLLSYCQVFSQEIQEYERELEHYFRQDKYRKAQKAYEWLWMNNPSHSQLFYQTGILLYDYLLHEGKSSETKHYQQMLDTLKMLTDADKEAIYNQRFSTYGHHSENKVDQLPPVPVLAKDYDVAPYYSGGMESFMKHLHDHLTFPNILKGYGTEAKVFVAFVIKADGEIDHVHVLRGITPEVDARIVEVVQGAPAWIPAQKMGEPVPVRVVLPIDFRYR